MPRSDRSGARLRSTRTLLVAAMLVIASCTALANAGPAAADNSSSAPRHSKLAVTGNFPDPGIFHYGSRWYLYRTGGLIGVTSSANANRGYGKVTSAMAHRPKWVSQRKAANPAIWAPDVFAIKDSKGPLFVMYYTAIKAGTDVHCIGIATSRSPQHGFVDNHSAPFHCPARRGYTAIDPSLFIGSKGGRYLLYKDNYQNKSGFQIVAIPMTDAGTSARGSARVILASSKRMEAPSALQHGGRVWLFLSRANYADCSYYTDVWSAKSITKKFTFSKNVLTKKTTGLCGPGGANVLQRGSSTYIAFHAWKNHTRKSGIRQTYVGTLRWASNGRPYLY